MGIFSRFFQKTHQPHKVNKKPLPDAELLCNAFPSELRKDVQAVFLSFYRTITYRKRTDEVLGPYAEFTVNNELVQIPYRIYYSKVYRKRIASLTETQKTIYYCILTRSNNGYLREKYVRLLLATDYPQWAIPFIVKMCDDYVLEITTAVYELLKDTDTTILKQFCQQNKKEVKNSYIRMINYWFIYDRQSIPNFYEFAGCKLFRECLGYNAKLRKHRKYIEQQKLAKEKNLNYLLSKKL